jgi:hypothetical protein
MAAKIPAKTANRIAAGMKKFQPILNSAKMRDLNESDTAAIVRDILAEVLGYDNYHEITSEHAIRGTYCDLAITVEGQICLLIEVKAVGLELKEAHIKQAIDYAANQGVEWVVLTNGINWKVFRVIFAQPIGQELVMEMEFPAMNPRSMGHVELLYLIAREGMQKSMLVDYHQQRQATNRFMLGAVLLSDPMLRAVRRELLRLAPTSKIQTSEIREALVHEVIKRDILEGEKAEEARKKVQKMASKQAKIKKSATAGPKQGAITNVRPGTDDIQPTPSITAQESGSSESPDPMAEPQHNQFPWQHR